MPTSGIIRVFVYEHYTLTTAGTNEAWPFLIRKNDTTDYAVDSVSLATNNRQWENYALNIPVSAGDFIEIVTDCPNWVTPPVDGAGGGVGYLVIESA